MPTKFSPGVIAAARDFLDLLDHIAEAERRRNSGAPKDQAGCYTYLYHNGLSDLSSSEIDIRYARWNLVRELKEHDGHRDLFLSDPDAFAQLCLDAMETASTQSTDVGIEWKNGNKLAVGQFKVPIEIGEQEIAALAAEKKTALARVHSNIEQIAEHARADEWSGGFARSLLRDATPPEGLSGNKEREILKTLREYIGDKLQKMWDEHRDNPVLACNTIMNQVVCTDWYLRKLQQTPAYVIAQGKTDASQPATQLSR